MPPGVAAPAPPPPPAPPAPHVPPAVVLPPVLVFVPVAPPGGVPGGDVLDGDGDAEVGSSRRDEGTWMGIVPEWGA